MSNCQHDSIWMSWSHPWPISFLWQCTFKPSRSELPNITRTGSLLPFYSLYSAPATFNFCLNSHSSFLTVFLLPLPPHTLFFIGLSREILIKPKTKLNPGGPVVKAPSFNCRGYGFNPWSVWTSHIVQWSQNKNKNQLTYMFTQYSLLSPILSG